MGASFTIKINPALIPMIEAKIGAALEICGGKAETYAKARCPKDTGNLQNSITHSVSGKTMFVGTPVYYAPYVEFGHHQQPGRFVPAIGKRLVAEYVPGKPFITPSLEEHVDEYKNVILTELQGM